MHRKLCFVFIVANQHRTIYTGVTGNLLRRIAEHRAGTRPGFCTRYRMSRLVYGESTPDVLSAIAREKQIKGWVRRKKIALIEATNPEWKDPSEDSGPSRGPSLRSG